MGRKINKIRYLCFLWSVGDGYEESQCTPTAFKKTEMMDFNWNDF